MAGLQRPRAQRAGLDQGHAQPRLAARHGARDRARTRGGRRREPVHHRRGDGRPGRHRAPRGRGGPRRGQPHRPAWVDPPGRRLAARLRPRVGAPEPASGLAARARAGRGPSRPHLGADLDAARPLPGPRPRGGGREALEPPLGPARARRDGPRVARAHGSPLAVARRGGLRGPRPSLARRVGRGQVGPKGAGVRDRAPGTGARPLRRPAGARRALSAAGGGLRAELGRRLQRRLHGRPGFQREHGRRGRAGAREPRPGARGAER